MEINTVSKSSVSFGLSLAIAGIVNAIIVCVKEKNETVMNGMKKLTGHHWITHTVIVLAVFILLGIIFSRINGGQGMKVTIGGLLRSVIGGVAVAGLIIVSFYLFAD